MPAAKDCHTLTSYFEKQYKTKYGSAPVVNRNTARWSFDSILQGMSVPECKELIDYYLASASEKRHNLQWFFYNYDKLIESQRDAIDDAERRKRLREESQERARKWREKLGDKRTTTD